MRVLVKNLFYHYGDAFNKYAVVYEDEFGVPLPLSGYGSQLRVKAKAGGGTGEPTLLVLTVGDGLTLDAPNGRVNASATAVKMLEGSLPVAGGVLAYDWQIKSPSGDPLTLLRGSFVVDPEVTTD
jgi:hypothetical protein